MNAREAIFMVIEYLEGDYSNDPKDSGGETKYGIAKKDHPNLDIRNLTKEQAYEIYKEEYWDMVKADAFPYPLNVLLFDFAVHSGPRRAIQVLQMTLKQTQDGLIGPRTIEAAQKKGKYLLEICSRYMAARTFFLASLNKPYFISGWTTRIFKLAFLCKLDAIG